MEPASFDQADTVLDKPQGFSHDQCGALSVFRGRRSDGLPVVISCWKPTREELAEIQRTGRVWLMVIGETMPPCYLDGHNPFE